MFELQAWSRDKFSSYLKVPMQYSIHFYTAQFILEMGCYKSRHNLFHEFLRASYLKSLSMALQQTASSNISIISTLVRQSVFPLPEHHPKLCAVQTDKSKYTMSNMDRAFVSIIHRSSAICCCLRLPSIFFFNCLTFTV